MSLTTFKGDLSVIGNLSLSDSGLSSIIDSTGLSSGSGPIITVGTNEYNHNGINSSSPLNWTGIVNYNNDSIAIASFGPDTTSSSTVNVFQMSDGYSLMFSSNANYSAVAQSKETGTANMTQQTTMPGTYTISATQYVSETLGTTTQTSSTITVTASGAQLSCSNGNNLLLTETNLSCNAPLYLDNGKITSDGNGNLGVANNLTLGWGSSLKIPNNDGSKTFTLSNNGSEIIANSGFTASGNVRGGAILTGAADYTSGIVGGQGSMLAWNLLSGDAYGYLVNIIPSSGYSSSGFKFYTTVLGEEVSGTPILQVDGSGNLQPKGNIKTSSGGQVIFDDSTGNNFTYIFQDNSVNRLRFYAGGSASGDVEFINNIYGKNVVLTGTSSLDNGMITTDGSGVLTLQNTNYANSPQYLQFITHSSDTNNNWIRMFWQHDDGKDSLGNTLTGNRFHFHNMMYGSSYEMHGTLYVGDVYNASLIATGSVTCNSINSDGGKIVSNGSGNLTISNGTSTSLTSTGEAHFGFNAFTDPDSGAGRDAKFGHNGIAVIGGTKTDTLTVTSSSSLDGGKITTNGSGSITMYGTMFFPTSTNSYGSYIGVENSTGNIVIGTQVAGGGGITGINELSANSLTISGKTTLDGGKITTNGSGNLYATSITTSTSGTISFSSESVASGATATITVSLPSYGLYYVTTTIYGTSTISGNIVVEKDSNMAVLYTSSTCQIITAGKSESYDGFGNLSSWTITTITVKTADVGELQATASATDSGTAGTWTFTGTMDYELVTTF